MAFAKAVVTGTVFRAPEKRFTQNNIPVSSFVLNIGDREEMLIRVVVRRASLDEVVSSISNLIGLPPIWNWSKYLFEAYADCKPSNPETGFVPVDVVASKSRTTSSTAGATMILIFFKSA